MAVDQHTTRRALFAGAFALTTIGGVAQAGDVELRPRTGKVLMTPEQVEEFNLRERFVANIASLHDEGGAAARHALAAGMKPDDLTMVVVDWASAKRGMLPALQFKSGKTFRTFRPRGEDQ